MKKDFRQCIKHLFSPDSIEVTIPFFKFKYTDEMRTDVSLVLGTLKGKGVLYANLKDEIWSHVFKSLKGIRDCLSSLSGKLQTKAPDDVKSAVDAMLNLVTLYLCEHEADYIRFMESPDVFNLGPFHRERNWPNLGRAAEDLLSLRKVLHAAVQNLNQYASTGEILEWAPPPEWSGWAEYAERRKLCPQCGWNMNYSYDEDCPICPTEKTVFEYSHSGTPVPIEIAGSFNGWNRQKMGDAWDIQPWLYIYRVKLSPGEYTYKFIVGGEWILDPGNPNTKIDEHGNLNSVILVSS